MPTISLNKPAFNVLDQQLAQINQKKAEVQPHLTELQAYEAENKRFLLFLIENAGFRPEDFDLNAIEYRKTETGAQISFKPVEKAPQAATTDIQNTTAKKAATRKGNK